MDLQALEEAPERLKLNVLATCKAVAKVDNQVFSRHKKYEETFIHR